jgi:hypothetical protein
MGFEFKSDQPAQQLVDSKTTLSVHEQPLMGEQAVAVLVEENLTQDIFAEGEEEKMAIQFIEETGLYTKFLLYCGIQEQLKNLKLSVATPTE